MAHTTLLRTSRLVVTTWEFDDVDALLEIHSDPETMRFVRHGRPETHAEVAALIRGYITEHERVGATRWRVADHSGALIGRAGFAPFRSGRELGYTLRRARWGQGLATEVAAALVDWHRQHAGRQSLWGFTSPSNVASARVLGKVGFLRVGKVDLGGEECPLFQLPPANDRVGS